MLKLMQRPGERLIIFTRYPEPGRAKTRLIPALGAEGAADLHRRLTERTLATARRLATLRKLTLEVRYAGGDAALMRQWLGGGLHLRAQGDGDLGARMREAFREAFEEGCYGVVLIGTDCPEHRAGNPLVGVHRAWRERVSDGPGERRRLLPDRPASRHSATV
jgi:glycosyltransferase A (GT-A) superfamily protein (DUF2064 family)